MTNKEAKEYLIAHCYPDYPDEGKLQWDRAMYKAITALSESDWIPISKDLPEELIAVNVTWTNRNPAPYYKEYNNERFVDTAVYYQGDWYWWDVVLVDVLKEYGNSKVTYIDSAIEIIAWRPLPEPYRGEQDV